MMSFLKHGCLLALCTCVSLHLFSQKGNPAGAADVPLEEQFNSMVQESNRYQRFRVVPYEWLSAMKMNMVDSMNAKHAEIDSLHATINSQTREIEAQANSITELNTQIAQLEQEKDGISLFGNTISKVAYNAFLWSLVALLLVGLLFFFGRGRLANAISSELRVKNDELSTDLEQARRRRLEVEQDLRRKLQDEINKRNNA
ncbi:MAG: hypothetical protein AAFU03_12585 [Bacteroidota bacterium]